MISAERPAAPIVAAASSAQTCRRLALCWGVTTYEVTADALEEPLVLAPNLVHELGLASGGDFLLLVTGGGSEQERSAPSIRLLLA